MLLNKNGKWEHQDKTWNLEDEKNSTFKIIDENSSFVMGINHTSLNDITLNGSDVPNDDSQKWFRGKAFQNGWFTLKNLFSGKVLNASSDVTTTTAGT